MLQAVKTLPKRINLQFRTRDDSEYVGVRRRGVFTVERWVASSPRLLEKAVGIAQEKMIAGLSKRGFEYIDEGFELRGPLPHLDVSGDSAPDPGTLTRPDPRDVKRWLEVEKHEKERVARDVVKGSDLVDYELIASFKKKRRPELRLV